MSTLAVAAVENAPAAIYSTTRPRDFVDGGVRTLEHSYSPASASPDPTRLSMHGTAAADCGTKGRAPETRHLPQCWSARYHHIDAHERICTEATAQRAQYPCPQARAVDSTPDAAHSAAASELLTETADCKQQ